MRRHLDEALRLVLLVGAVLGQAGAILYVFPPERAAALVSMDVVEIGVQEAVVTGVQVDDL